MLKYNHSFSVCFSVDSNSGDSDLITKEQLIEAMKIKINELESENGDIYSAVEGYDTIEN